MGRVGINVAQDESFVSVEIKHFQTFEVMQIGIELLVYLEPVCSIGKWRIE